MKLIMESWRQYVVENDVDDEEQREEDNLKHSILSQANSEAKALVRKLEDDMGAPEDQYDWIDDKIYDDLNDISFDAEGLGDLIKSVRNYFQKVGPTLGFDDLDLSGVLSELPPEVQNLMTLGEDGDAEFGADAEAEAQQGASDRKFMEEDDSFSDAAEKIKEKGTEGVFTAKAKKAEKSVQAYANQVLAPDSKASTKTKRQAAFAKGAQTIADKNRS